MLRQFGWARLGRGPFLFIGNILMSSASPAIDVPFRAPQTRWWHTGGNGKVVCTLCPRECSIPEGGRGFCFVRANVGGALELTTWGRSSGFCIDPIEKKPLNHFLPGTPVLSLGTAGCNLGCKFCQNWDISKSREMDTVASVATPEAIVAAAKQTGSRSIAFTYNDQTIWAEYAIDIAKVARQEGIRTVAVTAGYISPDAREEFYQWMDAANVDLKAFTDTFYRKLTQTNLQPILYTLEYLKKETNVWFEITNLMIPGENDSPEEIDEMVHWILDHLGDDVPIHFSAFHPDFKMMDKPRTPHETLIRARQQAVDAGIKFAYVGNVYDVVNESTYCPGCGTMVIERDWYELGAYRMKGNRCGKCDTVIPGVFENHKGDWGRKRQPIRIQSDYVSLTTKGKGEMKERSDSTKANAGPVAPKTDFSDTEIGQLLDFVRATVDAVVRGEPMKTSLPAGLADAPAYGAFVTLKRPANMRACRGRWGVEESASGPTTLGPLLEHVARDTAANDFRFARICEEELELLSIDVSVMHSPAAIEAAGDGRIAAVEIGKHGLVITHPRGRGLLLPNVATEGGYDARSFLEQVSLKANLPNDAWRDASAQLMTFQTRLMHQASPAAELDPHKLTPQRLSELVQIINRLVNGEPVREEEVPAVLTEMHGEESGLYILTESGLNATAIGPSHSLLDLAEIAANSFKDMMASRGKRTEAITRLALLWQPVRLDARDYPTRHQLLSYSAVLARDKGKWALSLPRSNQRVDKVGEALSQANINPTYWKVNQTQGLAMPRITLFNVLGFDSRRYGDDTTIRPAARAGQFYPGDADTIREAINRHFAAAGSAEAKPNRAVMLPHAGWRFCGDTIAKTLARTLVPDIAIIIGPNHTGSGAAWSIAPHKAWQLPGTIAPIATDVVEKLVDHIPGLECEANAHRMEHGTEVLLPFLQRRNPKVRVVPIVVGRCTYEDTQRFAQGLAEVVKEIGENVLLVISSDMNHFAPEAENRRLDMLALDAMDSGDPRKLYETCSQNRISMCGMVPAVIVMRTLSALDAQRPIRPERVDYCNSADATGDKSSVVGYAGVVIA